MAHEKIKITFSTCVSRHTVTLTNTHLLGLYMCIYTFEPTSLYIRPVNSPQKMGFWHENIHYKRYLIVLCCVGLPVCWFCGTRKKKINKGNMCAWTTGGHIRSVSCHTLAQCPLPAEPQRPLCHRSRIMATTFRWKRGLYIPCKLLLVSL